MEQKLMELRESLIGKQFSFIELDNEMMEHGIYSEFADGLDWKEISESGVICYYADGEDYFYIYFTVVSGIGVDTTVKVTDITLE